MEWGSDLLLRPDSLVSLPCSLLQSGIPSGGVRTEVPAPEQLVAQGAVEHLANPTLPWAGELGTDHIFVPGQPYHTHQAALETQPVPGHVVHPSAFIKE